MLFCAGLYRVAGGKTLEERWILANDLRSELAAANPPITSDQIERWWREGLLPRPRQIGKGRGRGSRVEVPERSIVQAQEIARLYKVREKRAWVGWRLWLTGFEVDERFWRAPLQDARTLIIETQRAARRFERSPPPDIGDVAKFKATALNYVRQTPLYAPLAKISPELVETLAGFLQELLLGRFVGFSLETSSRPNSQELAAVLAVLGSNTASKGPQLSFAPAIETVLRDMSKAYAAIARRNSPFEPSLEARQELVAAIDIGTLLYRFARPALGRNALGLGTLNRIAANPAVSLQAMMLIGWTEYRKSGDILPFSQIEEMRKSVAELVSDIDG